MGQDLFKLPETEANPDPALVLAQEFFIHSNAEPRKFDEVNAWETNTARILYIAQTIVDEQNRNSKNQYILFRSMGIKVKWPGLWTRLKTKVKKLLNKLIEEGKKIKQKNDEKADALIKEKIIVLQESVRSLRDKEGYLERSEFREKAVDFNALIRMHGQRLGLNLEEEKY